MTQLFNTASNMKRNKKGKKMSQQQQQQQQLNGQKTTQPAAKEQTSAQAQAEEKPAQEAKGQVIPDGDAPPPDHLLVRILSTKRAHGSDGDRDFRLWLFNYLAATLKVKPQIKVEGNIYVETDPKSTVLFSCHVDTVHSFNEKGVQQLAFDPAFGHLFLADKDKDSCLGADDGNGVYIMIRMLEAGVKGKFMFHVGEERGGVGANAFVKQNAKFCEDIEMVVAFDRAVRSGENPEVIISQGGKRCASDEFGTALAKALSEGADFEKPYVISHKGSFTDSKVYSDIVPECVNVGCFYERQHSKEEYTDTVGLEKLVQAAIKVDWSMLPIKRDPSKAVSNGYTGTYNGYPTSLFDRDEDDDMPDFRKHLASGFGKVGASKPAAAAAKPQAPKEPVRYDIDLEEIKTMSKTDLYEYLMEDPDGALDIIVELLIENAGLQGKIDALKMLAG